VVCRNGGMFRSRSVPVRPQRRRLPCAARYGLGHGVLYWRGGIPSILGRLRALVAAVKVGGVYRVVGRLWIVGGREGIGGKSVQICGGVRVEGGRRVRSGVEGVYVVERVAVMVLALW
jgi:hypothetical protein